jgi:hypothetical protein
VFGHVVHHDCVVRRGVPKGNGQSSQQSNIFRMEMFYESFNYNTFVATPFLYARSGRGGRRAMAGHGPGSSSNLALGRSIHAVLSRVGSVCSLSSSNRLEIEWARPTS